MAGWSYTFRAVKGDKGLTILGRPYFNRCVDAHLADGEECVLTISEMVVKRTSKQNKANWGPVLDQVVDIICAKEGYRKDEWKKYKPLIHEGLTGRYGGYEVCPVSKKDVRKFRTSTATVAEMADYMDWIAQFIAEEYGEAIVMPGEM